LEEYNTANGSSRNRVRKIGLMMWPTGVAWCCAMAAGQVSGDADADSQASEDVRPFTVQAEAALRKEAGEGFKIKCTKHFAVAYDENGEGIGELLPRLESTYQSINRFYRVQKLPASLPDEHLEIIFFDSYERYAAYAGRVGFACKGTHGFYFDSTNRCAFFNTRRDPQFVALQRRIEEVRANIAALEIAIRSAASADAPINVTFADGTSRQFTKAEARAKIDGTRAELTRIGYVLANYCERINRMVIQHEAAHQVLFNSGVHVRMAENPLWFVEGLACVFETPPTQSGAGLGVTNSMRLCDFRSVAGGGEPKGDLTEDGYFRAVRAGTLAGLKRLLADRTLLGQRGDDAGYAYCQAWGLVYYLQRTKSRELATYVARVSQRHPGERISADRELADFEGAFGPADETFERAWVRWVLKLPFKPGEAGL
jgi:hypothetical protein